jgi:hypothetical protein
MASPTNNCSSAGYNNGIANQQLLISWLKQWHHKPKTAHYLAITMT